MARFGGTFAGVAAFAAVLAILSGPGQAQQGPGPQSYDAGRWWSPNDGRPFPRSADFPNDTGALRVILDGGPMETAGHPFFTPMSANGRACVSCHQPSDSMSLSVASIRERWQATKGADPIFATFDGANCPDKPRGEAASHSLLLEKGLFRIARPWPPQDADGKPIKPDFDIEVVRDPTGCNLSPQWGLESKRSEISVYRRPRILANMKYVLAMGFALDPKPGLPLPIDPETGKPASGNLMADRRVLNLTAQMRDAALTHLEFAGRLSQADIDRILDFEMRIYASQQVDKIAGDLSSDGATGGTQTLVSSSPGRLGSQGVAIWSEYAAWASQANVPGLTPEQRAFRESVARGAKIFREKTFLISDSMGINWPIGFGNPVRNTCAFCHNMSQAGMDVAPGQVDLGTTTMPFADPQPDLPLFKISCKGKPHPAYGATIFTHDPGYALTTGMCADVGRITLQSLRGAAARAPFFSNGSAKDLRTVVDYYERRYNIGLTEQEKQDLVNLMRVL